MSEQPSQWTPAINTTTGREGCFLGLQESEIFTCPGYLAPGFNTSTVLLDFGRGKNVLEACKTHPNDLPGEAETAGTL